MNEGTDVKYATKDRNSIGGYRIHGNVSGFLAAYCLSKAKRQKANDDTKNYYYKNQSNLFAPSLLDSFVAHSCVAMPKKFGIQKL